MPALAYRTKLPRPDDPDILDTIFEEVSLGVPLSTAAIKAGVSEWTAWHWDEDGRKALQAFYETGQAPGELGSVALFAQVVKEAKAGFVSDAVRQWRTSKVNDWARWATLLQRRDPENFGIRDKLEIDQRATLRIEVVTPLTVETQAKALSLFQNEARRLLLSQHAGEGETEDATEAQYTELPPTPTT